jgi:S-adenosylmethionine:tRNA ribosyltransferase-isomerase
MRLADFDFPLPRELIADQPAEPREIARLLVVPASGPLADRHVRDLPELLHPGDLLVVNDTKVIPARLVGRRGEATVELTLACRLSDDSSAPDSRFHGGGRNLWRAFVKGARRLRPGDRIEFGDDFSCTVQAKQPDGDVILHFDLDPEAFRSALARHGSMPVPPYIKRPRGGDRRDLSDYQTMFAREEGAVAAPTAGLHFTPRLLDGLAARGVERLTVTLHVGPGTFLPVKTDDPRDHQMHAERGVLTDDSARRLNAARARGGRIIAVGTTSLRLLESSLSESGEFRAFGGETRLFILPGYRVRAVDLLLTNFHLPRSTLFMLVAALAGLDRIKSAYAHAVAERYRFFSYGDACLIEIAG